jgi:hypothetical protein
VRLNQLPSGADKLSIGKILNITLDHLCRYEWEEMGTLTKVFRIIQTRASNSLPSKISNWWRGFGWVTSRQLLESGIQNIQRSLEGKQASMQELLNQCQTLYTETKNRHHFISIAIHNFYLPLETSTKQYELFSQKPKLSEIRMPADKIKMDLIKALIIEDKCKIICFYLDEIIALKNSLKYEALIKQRHTRFTLK